MAAMHYLFLSLAVVAEVIATSALKASAGFTNLVPSMIAVVGVALSLMFMAMTVKAIPIGVAYALWSGLGIVLIAGVEVFMHKKAPDPATMAGLALIIGGCITVNLAATSD
jgi:small multidrug resistance pump